MKSGKLETTLKTRRRLSNFQFSSDSPFGSKFDPVPNPQLLHGFIFAK